AQARDFARDLAGARDAQAAIEALEDLLEKDAPLSPRTVASIKARLDALRVKAEADRLTQATRAQMIVALDVADTALGAWPVDKTAFAETAKELGDPSRRARAHAREGDWREAKPELLHEMRSRVVAHRYQMELVEPLWPKFGKLWVAEAQRLRDRLG